MLFLALLAIAIASPANAFALRVPATTYTSDTTWTQANSPYVLDGNITVNPGVTLTIDPGVVVKLSAQTRTLTVKGVLQALGTADQSVVFTSIKDDTDGSDSGGDGPTLGAPGQWFMLNLMAGSTAHFDYADLRYGGYGSAS